MKEFNKFIKTVKKDSRFEVTKSGRKATIKIVYIESRDLYSVHPADHAIRNIKSWINKKENGK